MQYARFLPSVELLYFVESSFCVIVKRKSEELQDKKLEKEGIE